MTSDEADRLREFADRMATALIVSNKDEGIKVALEYQDFINHLDGRVRDAV